ncbi:MAG: glycosyltransferase family 4 protein, partial [bacterium]
MQSLQLIFADGSSIYNGNSPETYPLGGSQSALVYLTRALAKLGHDVHVYNNCSSPGVYHGVHYHQIKEITEVNRFLYSDAFISLRNPRVFHRWVNSGACILWSQDAFDQNYLQEIKTNEDIRHNIDAIFCVSKWQAWTFMTHLHWPADKIFITRNAIWSEYYPKEFSEPPGRRLVYTSTPFRGLELLLQLFPRIYKAVPDAELHVFSSMQVYQQDKAEEQKKFGHIYELANQPGVTMHGSVGQKVLASELIRCRVLAYPNIFPETSCIAAMEALAAGCAVVTSH